MITETVTYSVSDGVAAPVVGNLNFSIVGENDLPSISPIDRLVVQSDTSTALDLSLLAIDDPDTDVLELSLSVTAGAITANPDVPGVSVTVSAEGQITVAGQADALSAYLVDGVRFIDPADQALGQSAHLMVAVSDGTAPQEIAPIMIDVAGVAETARISGSLGDVSGIEDQPVTLEFADFEIIDTDSDVVVTFAIPDGAQISMGPTERVLAQSPDSNTFTLTGAPEAISQVIQSGGLIFTPPVNINGTLPPIAVSVAQPNGSGLIQAGEIRIELAAVADAPTLAGIDPRGLIEGQPVVLTPDLVLDAPDLAVLNNGEGDFSGSSIHVMSRTPATDSLFTLANTAEFDVVSTAPGTWELRTDGGTFATFSIPLTAFQTSGGVNDFEPRAVISFGGPVTPTTALVHAATRALAFDVGSEQPTFGQPQLSWTFLQPDGTSATQQQPITVSYTNDPFVITPTSQALVLNEDVTAALDLAGVTASDPDSGSLFHYYTLSVDAGQLSLDPAADQSGALQLNADGTISVSTFAFTDLGTLIGTSVLYTPPSDLSGVDAANLTIQGTGVWNSPDPEDYGSLTLPITITPVNDAATFSGELGGIMSEAADTLSGQITVTDIDSENTLQAQTLDGQFGQLAIAADGSWIYTKADNNPDLALGEQATDHFVITAADGTTTTLVITIDGLESMIDGTASNDNLAGTSGGDTFVGGAGNDHFNGGAGQDTAEYAGDIDSFQFNVRGRTLFVADRDPTQNGNEGRDALTDVEHITFNNDAFAEIETLDNGETRLTLVDATAENSAFDWSQQTQTYSADGLVRATEYVYDDGTTRSETFSYENGMRTGRVQTDGTGSRQNRENWSSIEETYSLDRSQRSRHIEYDDGTTRTIDVTYTDGVPNLRVMTDGSDTQSSANWSRIEDHFDADGNIVSRFFEYDNGTSRSQFMTYSDGVRTSRRLVDGTGDQSSANWSLVEDSYDLNGQLTTRLYDYDNGDRMVMHYVDGILISRVREDLSDSRNYESVTQTYDNTGALIDTSYVWDTL